MSADVQRRVDELLNPDLHLLTARRAGQAARRLVIGFPHDADFKAKRARTDRHVNVVAAPDSVGKLNLYTTAEQAWACFGALDGHARGLKADGDDRTISQNPADATITGRDPRRRRFDRPWAH